VRSNELRPKLVGPQPVPYNYERLQKSMANVDKNTDGSLSFGEFCFAVYDKKYLTFQAREYLKWIENRKFRNELCDFFDKTKKQSITVVQLKTGLDVMCKEITDQPHSKKVE